MVAVPHSSCAHWRCWAQLSISFPLPSGAEYGLDLDLAGEVLPADTKVLCRPTKVELKLHKATPGSWPALEASAAAAPAAAAAPVAAAAPSFVSKQKAWDDLARELEEEEDKELTGDAALQKLFRDIYAKADEDTRRAMIKSFVRVARCLASPVRNKSAARAQQTSGGTVLSTNWSEVAKADYEKEQREGKYSR